MDERARNIAQECLDKTGEALLACDFDLFAPCFHLPHVLATDKGMRRLRNMSDLSDMFHRMSTHYREIGVTQLDRRIDVALFDGPDTVRYSYTTRMFHDNQLLRDPFHNHSVMRDDGTRWAVADSTYAVNDLERIGAILLAVGETDAMLDMPPGAAAQVLQNNLDSEAEAYLDGDFDAFCSHIQLPLFLQSSAGSQVFATRDALKRDFDRYQTEFSVHHITDLVRLVKSAETVGDKRMHGTFRTFVLSGTQLVLPAYTSAITLEQGNDLEWRTTTVMHPMGHLTLSRVAEGRL